MKDQRNNPRRANIDVESEAPAKEPKILTGHITGCDLLNVRRDPTVSSAIIDALTPADLVVVLDVDVILDFYKVTTPRGISGYCMKQFVKLDD